MGPLQAAIDRKGEGASFATITPTEFHYDFREIDWQTIGLTVAAGGLLAGASVLIAPFVGAAAIVAGPAQLSAVVAKNILKA